MKRRRFLKTVVITSATGVAVTNGILSPSAVFADSENTDVTQAKSVDEVLKIIGVSDVAASDMIKIKSPEIAENGALVPVVITSEIDNTSEIILLVANNPIPYAARYVVGKSTVPAVKSRLKMAKTSDVIAIIKANDKFYTAKANIKVTKGGCGG